MQAKEKGFSDAQIAWMLKCTEDEVYEYRTSLGIRRAYKMVDTCAAEFTAQTPYYYSTFEGASVNGEESNPVNVSILSDPKKEIFLVYCLHRFAQAIAHGRAPCRDTGCTFV